MKYYLRLFLLLTLACLIPTGCRSLTDDPKPVTEAETVYAPVGRSDASKFICRADENGLTILGYSGIESAIAIPAQIDGKPVYAIAENAFRDFTDLESVVIPDSVAVIDYAFVSCRDLKSVRIGKGVVSMNGAFRGCTALASVTGGESVAECDEAFLGCVSLTEITLPGTVTSAVSTFAGCTALTDVTLREGIGRLDHTFTDCRSLSEIYLPPSVTEAPSAFLNCSSLLRITGGDGLTFLDGTFENCTGLTAFTVPASLTRMKGAFVGCSRLAEIISMPDRLVSYEPSFAGCRSLRELFIPEITDPAALAAYDPAKDVTGCVSLRTVTIRADFSVRDSFCRTFSGCPLLESVTLPDAAAAGLLKLTCRITDAVYSGDNKAVTAALKVCKKASAARITPNYAVIDGQSYTHVYGGDVDVPDPEAVIAKTPVLPYKPFSLTSFWCGYPDGGQRESDSVAVCRTWSFLLQVTGVSDGTLPETVTVNGYVCPVGTQ